MALQATKPSHQCFSLADFWSTWDETNNPMATISISPQLFITQCSNCSICISNFWFILSSSKKECLSGYSCRGQWGGCEHARQANHWTGAKPSYRVDPWKQTESKRSRYALHIHNRTQHIDRRKPVRIFRSPRILLAFYYRLHEKQFV